MNRDSQERIEYCDELSRNENYLITDPHYEKLERNLSRIHPNQDFFNNKALRLPSLPKIQTNEFLDGLLPNTRLLIEPKINGYAIAIKYEDGKFSKAISKKGKDVSNKIKAIKSVPKQINIRSCFMVRGELFATEEEPSSSKRITSRYLRSRDYNPNPKISFCAFQIINTNCNEYESIIYCRKLGFTIPKFIEANRTSQIDTFRHAWKSKKLFLEYPTDGIVVKINSSKLQLLRERSFGICPHWQIAIKY